MWLSHAAVKAKRRRRRLERKWKKTGREEIRLQYRQACRQANSLIVEARQKYHRDQLNDASENPRRKWAIVRNILHQNSLADTRPFSECLELANKLSRFFS